jgi:hypothetical protein
LSRRPLEPRAPRNAAAAIASIRARIRAPFCARIAAGISLIAAMAVMGTRTASAGDDFDGLMALLAQHTHARADFVEQQFLAVLDRPLESWGALVYDAPDHLEKRTEKPREEILLVSGDTIIIERAHRRHELDLRKFPQVLPFVEGIRATLAGDRAALERAFHVEFSGDLGQWMLLLQPSQPALRTAVSQIRIDGERDQLLHVEIIQADGDRSLMTLRPAATKRASPQPTPP